jgi:hypothetical protein
VVAAMLLVLIMFALAGAALVVFVGLLIRYLALAVLLVLSPFAYLFVAFPNTANLAKLWWKHFFRYVFYAPVVLLILIATAKFAGSEEWKTLIAFIEPPAGEGYDSANIRATMSTLIQKAAIAVGLMAAAGSGRWAGIVGSAAAMSAVSKAGARGKGVYLRGLRRGGRAATRGAATVTGARVATRYAGGQLSAFGRTVGGNILTRVPGLRNLGGGTGRKLADRLVRKGRSPADAGAATATRTQLGTGAPGSSGKLANAAFAPQNLRRRSVGEEMMRAPGGADVNVRPVFREGNLDQIRNFAKNQELGKLSGEQRINIVADLLVNPQVAAMPANDRGKFVDEITRALEESNKQFTS